MHTILLKSSRHVGGNMKAGAKISFVMKVAAELNSLSMQNSFVAFTRTKIEEEVS